MPAPKLIRYAYWGFESLVLLGALFTTIWFATAGEWQPWVLVVVVLLIGLLSETLTIVTRDGTLNPSLVAFVMAMSLLGPGPAMACGVAVAVVGSIRRRLSLAFWLGNLAGYAVPACVGAWLVRAVSGGLHGTHALTASGSVAFALLVFGAFVVFTGLNFVLIGLDLLVEEGRSLARQARELMPLVSAELATGAIATIAAVAYRGIGLPVLFAAIGVLLIFRHLMVALLRSEDRADQLEARSRQLVGLQLGVLRTLVRALGMRDKTTGRHAAAVARYARAMATELGCDEDESDMIHTAGLLHEIGKFTWPDRVLHAEVIADQDLEFVKSHPQEGAVLVGALDGYGSVADAILYHRERVDGTGYPAGLIGQEIPLASRIIAICSTYDTITAGDGYRPAMPPAEALEELRHGATNGQFDGELVERFIELVLREGGTFAQDADFETELEFERRVHRAAEPHSASPESSQGRTRPLKREAGRP